MVSVAIPFFDFSVPISLTCLRGIFAEMLSVTDAMKQKWFGFTLFSDGVQHSENDPA